MTATPPRSIESAERGLLPQSFRKKPVVIEAMQLTAESFWGVWNWLGDNAKEWDDEPLTIMISTLEGQHIASLGGPVLVVAQVGFQLSQQHQLPAKPMGLTVPQRLQLRTALRPPLHGLRKQGPSGLERTRLDLFRGLVKLDDVAHCPASLFS